MNIRNEILSANIEGQSEALEISSCSNSLLSSSVQSFRIFASKAAAVILFSSLPYMGVVGNASADALVDALSERHTVPTFAELETIAGGHDELIARLIELQGSSAHLVGMRSAKILLDNFNGEETIAAALEDDLQRSDRRGIAQAIALNLDNVQSTDSRMRLAKFVLDKAKSDSEYAVYAKSLTSSKDAAVRELAKKALP